MSSLCAQEGKYWSFRWTSYLFLKVIFLLKAHDHSTCLPTKDLLVGCTVETLGVCRTLKPGLSVSDVASSSRYFWTAGGKRIRVHSLGCGGGRS